MELNRRLAPDVYLGVSSVSGAELPPYDARAADGAAVEHLVVMRRMPDDRRLSTLVRAGAPVGDELRRLARSVAAFHASAPRAPSSPQRAAATRSPGAGRRTSSRCGPGAPCSRRRRSTPWIGRPDLADAWLDAYVEFTGDPAPVALRHHYVAYRAFVRAKVACLRHEQRDPAAAAEATRYANLSARHLQAGAVRLALVGGLPGTGKSTVGGALADRFGAVLLSSDRLRKELAGLSPAAPAPAAYGTGLYTVERTDELYAELLHRAGDLLTRGESVVIDASWTHSRHRAAADDLAVRTHSDLVRLECRVPADVAAARLVHRGPTASDATTTTVACAMSTDADPWPEAVTVSTSGELADSLQRAAEAWRRQTHEHGATT